MSYDGSAGKAVGQQSGNPAAAQRRTRKRRRGVDSQKEVTVGLPDYVKPALDILFVGINPGVTSASVGHHYAKSSNHFWPCLYESGLIPEKLLYKDDARCLDYSIGLTNMVARTTRGSSDLSREEMRMGSEELKQKVQDIQPKIVCFNGKGIFEVFTGKKCKLGQQSELFPGTSAVVYVMPSSSARTASHPRASDKLEFFRELKQLRDKMASSS
ncbi:G/T mismatch-specific thymine DNA glycosylase-like isoform X2 [Corticium candelabrum]|uniref:G/T mismatch-specific thymine DNA glycosylase-like isoform X2 n=1 Tax=Corticium candelabrum TaxID=121492 RepID=UPI002E276AA7|nr:G/T mismatch-specific thymine DNA glycosylase-like isoform X2 [Corticium candelabrum]